MNKKSPHHTNKLLLQRLFGKKPEDKTYAIGKDGSPVATEDITGKKYNKLTAIEYVEKKNRVYFWKFKCDCGNEKVIGKQYVVNGNTKSCGCLKKSRKVEN